MQTFNIILFVRRRDDEGEVKTEELELDRVGMEDNDISQYYETISIHTESSQPANTKLKTSDSITRYSIFLQIDRIDTILDKRFTKMLLGTNTM